MRFGGLIVAIVLAVVAAVIVLRSSANKQPETQVAPVGQAEQIKSVNIYVAAKPIPVGTKITSDMVAVQPWPEHLVLPGFVHSDDANAANSIVGTVARGSFQAQEPILMNRLANANDPGFLAGALPKGMRVITLSTNEIEGVAGFIFPGDHVDVLMTHEVDKDVGGEAGGTVKTSITETLLSNAKIVAVDQRPSSDGGTDKDGHVLVPRSVSLMVSLADAQRLRLGAKEGTLTLALRSINDQESSDALAITQVGDISQFQGGGDSGSGVRVLRGAPGDFKETSPDAAAALRAGLVGNETVMAPSRAGQ